jgi:hypothetical protein
MGAAAIAAAAAVADGAGAAPEFRASSSSPSPLEAMADGVADDSDALSRGAAAAGSGLTLPPGTYRLARDVAFKVPVFFQLGAVLVVDRGVTVTFQAGLSAGAWQVFDATASGRVVINPEHLIEGYPEWWGARANDPGFDCQPAIQACVDACVITRLHAADYTIGRTVKITVHGRSLIGTSADQNGNRRGSRLVLTSGTLDGLQVGYDSQPADSKHWLEHVTVRDLTIIRSARLENPREGFAQAPVGVRLQWAVTCSLERVETIEHSHGFYITGTVHCFLRYCQALRYKAGLSPANDFFHGFFMDNSVASGFNSGNASLYFQNCATFSTQSVPFSESSGIKSYAGYTDTFIIGFECALVQCGLDMIGRSSSAADYQSEDLIIETCVIDSPTSAGIRIRSSGPLTAVQVGACYIAPAGPGVAFDIQDCHGSVGISACQVISTPGNSATGLKVVRSSGVSASNNIHTDIRNPIVLEDCAECRVTDTINNVRQKTETAAVLVKGLARSLLAPMVRGSAGIHPAGVVFVGASNERNEVNCTGIAPQAVEGGGSAILLSDGRPIASAGPFDSNLASGLVG